MSFIARLSSPEIWARLTATPTKNEFLNASFSVVCAETTNEQLPRATRTANPSFLFMRVHRHGIKRKLRLICLVVGVNYITKKGISHDRINLVVDLLVVACRNVIRQGCRDSFSPCV